MNLCLVQKLFSKVPQDQRRLSKKIFKHEGLKDTVKVIIIIMIFDIAPFPPIMFKSAFESLDSCHGPYSQLNSFRNSNVFSCLLKFCTLSAALMLSGSSFQRLGA